MLDDRSSFLPCSFLYVTTLETVLAMLRKFSIRCFLYDFFLFLRKNHAHLIHLPRVLPLHLLDIPFETLRIHVRHVQELYYECSLLIFLNSHHHLRRCCCFSINLRGIFVFWFASYVSWFLSTHLQQGTIFLTRNFLNCLLLLLQVHIC